MGKPDSKIKSDRKGLNVWKKLREAVSLLPFSFSEEDTDILNKQTIKMGKIQPLHSYITVWLERLNIKKPVVPKLMTEEERKLHMMLIDEEMQELLLALSRNDDLTELCDAYFDVLWVVTQAAMVNGININDIVRAGSMSNLSKFCSTSDEAYATVDAYGKGTHPDKQGVSIETYVDEQDGVFIVKRTKDNKVMKSINFSQPNFNFIVDRAK